MAKVCYVWSQELIEETDRLPAVPGRASLVNNLLEAYGLHKHITVVTSKPASYEDLRLFHSELYLDHLKTFKEVDDDYMTDAEDEEYGFGYDCPPVSRMFELVTTIAGGSITAARCLTLGLADVAINWCGGWHHASRFGAEGYCYVNDIVIAIENLRKKFTKVLYIDLDVHHGNGVEDAYNLSRTVFTLSFHKLEPGFYPGTGRVEDVGNHVGKGYCCNVPLHAAYNDQTLEYAFGRVFESVFTQFAPQAIVIQCGADALARDPHGGANLTARGYCACVRVALHKRTPTLLLGGGGYNNANTARLWVAITATVAGVTLDEDIPDHDSYEHYAPDYMLGIGPTLLKDENSRAYLDDCVDRITDNLAQYLPKTKETNEEPIQKKTKLIAIQDVNEDITESENCVCDAQ